MILVIHIFAAIAGLVMSTIAFFLPTFIKIKISYYLVFLTIATGTIIVIAEHLSILSVCLSGLLYIGYTVSGLIMASRRLANQNDNI
jgi:hypothetical protein